MVKIPKLGNHLFVQTQSSKGDINIALDIWAAMVLKYGVKALWKNARDLYATIDVIQLGNVYDLCTRDVWQLLHQQLVTTAFKDHINLVPYHQFNHAGRRVWSNVIMFCAAIGGSDKTTVSPPKKHRKKPEYQKFVQQLYHACLAWVFTPLKPGMTTPEVVLCPDGHYRRVIYGLGPYIADYPEQVWLAAIVQNWCPKVSELPRPAGSRVHGYDKFLITIFNPGTLWDNFGIWLDVVPFTYGFPWADIHELLSSDLLHQVIKGTFKDYLVSWANNISAVPEFPGLHRFPDGRDYNQWTGDDSKALMKIYLGAVAGSLPSDMIKCLSAFMDFCYLIRQNSISSDDLGRIQAALDRFHQYRDIFIQTGRTSRITTYMPNNINISLPCQHSLVHYIRFIQLFGSPNGLCSSITESKHIKAVKEPWHRSSHFNVLPQMLVTDPVLTSILECNYPHHLIGLATHISQPCFPPLFRHHLYDLIHGSLPNNTNIAVEDYPVFGGKIYVHHGAIAWFYAPSNLCSAGGMYRDYIHSSPNWHSYPQHDTVLIEAGTPTMHGLIIGRTLRFFSFTFGNSEHRCALVCWLVPVGDSPDPDMGM
ncbi:hypothetical protein C8J57DRAFT_1441213 [Mycena rebaudengoi]|nr:hypothetical protein C8J57DRAFT_1441213 [Mycena rebaudengoi]